MDDWNEMMAKIKEGDVVTGNVTRKIKGGLLVDIGVNVFLPASQVDIRRPATSATTSAASCSAKCSRSTKPAATSSSAAAR